MNPAKHTHPHHHYDEKKLERLLIAGLKDKKDVQLLLRILRDSRNTVKMDPYREKILELLDALLYMSTTDYTIWSRMELYLRQHKLFVEDRMSKLNTIKRVIAERVSSNKFSAKRQKITGRKSNFRLKPPPKRNSWGVSGSGTKIKTHTGRSLQKAGYKTLISNSHKYWKSFPNNYNKGITHK